MNKAHYFSDNKANYCQRRAQLTCHYARKTFLILHNLRSPLLLPLPLKLSLLFLSNTQLPWFSSLSFPIPVLKSPSSNPILILILPHTWDWTCLFSLAPLIFCFFLAVPFFSYLASPAKSVISTTSINNSTYSPLLSLYFIQLAKSSVLNLQLVSFGSFNVSKIVKENGKTNWYHYKNMFSKLSKALKATRQCSYLPLLNSLIPHSSCSKTSTSFLKFSSHFFQSRQSINALNAKTELLPSSLYFWINAHLYLS